MNKGLMIGELIAAMLVVVLLLMVFAVGADEHEAIRDCRDHGGRVVRHRGSASWYCVYPPVRR